MVKVGTVVVLVEAEAAFNHLKGLLETYRSRGYKKANLVGIEVAMLGMWSAIVTVHWIIDRTDGTVLRDFRTSYNLFNEKEHWKILVTTNHDS